jgi:dihydrolipoyl dehydrogenase
VPNRLLVVGGGYIGLELGTVYAALGSRVTVVEMTDGLLPGADRDLAAIVARRMETYAEAILLETKVTSVKDDKKGLAVSFEGKNAPSAAQVFDRVLVAVGRRPNSAIAGLDTTRVKVNQRGFIEVDAQRRTAEPSIFAIGDVAGDPMLRTRRRTKLAWPLRPFTASRRYSSRARSRPSCSPIRSSRGRG